PPPPASPVAVRRGGPRCPHSAARPDSGRRDRPPACPRPGGGRPCRSGPRPPAARPPDRRWATGRAVSSRRASTVKLTGRTRAQTGRGPSAQRARRRRRRARPAFAGAGTSAPVPGAGTGASVAAAGRLGREDVALPPAGGETAVDQARQAPPRLPHTHPGPDRDLFWKQRLPPPERVHQAALDRI